MNLITLRAMREALAEKLQQLERITPNCHSCRHFEHGHCAKFGAVPNDFQRAVGECQDWLHDGVPF